MYVHVPKTNWQQICAPLQHGGLGIRNLSIFNKALLGKWLWRYGVDHEALWRRVVDSKYGSQWGGWCSHRVHVPYGEGLWKFIRIGWDSFSRHSAFKVGVGSRVKSWLDTWCGDQPLRDSFPELFRLARVPDASVADHLLILGSSHHWDIERRGNYGSFVPSLQGGKGVMEFCFPIFWHRLGVSGSNYGASFWVVELVWKDFFRGVELGYLLLDVDNMAGEKCRTFENIENSIGKIIEDFFGSLFDWSCVWGLTSSSSVGDLLESLAFDNSAVPLHIWSQLLESFSGMLIDWSRAWGVTSVVLLADFGAAWDPDGRMILIAFSGSSTLGSIHFASKPPSLDAHLLAVDLPEILSLTGSQGIEKIAWDASGERLAVSYKGGDELYRGLIAIYDARRTPLLSASLIGFIRGPGENPKPRSFSFHDKFKQGPLLSVCWSSGFCCTYPLIFRSHVIP
uniref:Reverse transcriptase zinc-binding domain-containing protein n=1 Tax=Fagus sylvatica TaxID=28930 RepID=A0A2N9GYI8_FAGSY